MTRISAIADKQHLHKRNGLDDLLKTHPSSWWLHYRIWLFYVKGCRYKYRSPKIRERWNSILLGWEVCLTPRYMPLPDMCYHVKFGSAATKSIRIHVNRREPQNWGAHAVWPTAIKFGTVTHVREVHDCNGL